MKPGLFFLHGWSGTDRIWDGLKKQLTQQYNCITPNLNNLFAEYGEDNFINGLKTRIEEAGPVYLCGWSLGALLALQLAVLGCGNPLGIIIFNGTGYFSAPDETGVSPVIIRKLRINLAKNFEQEINKFWESIFTSNEIAKGFLEKYRSLVRLADLDLNFLHYGLNCLENINLLPDLPRINLPVLILHGQEDQICPVKAGCLIKDLLSKSSLRCYPSSGHAVFFTKEEEVLNQMETFLNQNEC